MVQLFPLVLFALNACTNLCRSVCFGGLSAQSQNAGGEAIPLTIMNIALALAVFVCTILVLLKVYSGIVRKRTQLGRSKKDPLSYPVFSPGSVSRCKTGATR